MFPAVILAGLGYDILVKLVRRIHPSLASLPLTHFYCNAKTLFTYTGPVFAYLGGRGLGGKVLVQLVHCEREDWNRDDNLSLSPQGGRGNFIAISGCSLTSGWVLDREVKRDMYVASRDLPTHCPLALTKYELVPSSMLCLKFKFVNMVWNCLAKNFLTWRLKYSSSLEALTVFRLYCVLTLPAS